MDVTPASITQVMASRQGSMVTIDSDVGGVAQTLQTIDSNLKLRYSESGGFFVVYHEQNGKEYLVTTAQECDHRIVNRVREISSENYEFSKQLDAIHDAANVEQDRRLHEAVGEIGQRFAHAARKDAGYDKSSIVVP